MTQNQRQAAVWTSFMLVALTAAIVIPGQQRALLHSHGRLHPWFHLAVFAGLAFLAARVTRVGRVHLSILLMLVLFGCATEYTEHWEFGTTLEQIDMVVDAVGVMLGTAVSLLLLHMPGRTGEAGTLQSELKDFRAS